MLTGAEFGHLIVHVMPVYVIVGLGYLLVRSKIILLVHSPGINRWVSMVAIPVYAGSLVAYNDPYKVSIRLVGADVLQKVVALLVGGLYWQFSKTGKIDHMINFYLLATLPNTVLIGDALLQPLYGVDIQENLVTIVFLQTFLWYNLCTALYELRFVLLEMKEEGLLDDAGAAKTTEKENHSISSHKSDLSIDVGENKPHEKIGNQTPPNLSSSLVLEGALSISHLASFQNLVPTFNEPFHDDLKMKGLPMPGGDYRVSRTSLHELNGGKAMRMAGGHDQDVKQEGFESDMVEVVNPPEQEKPKAKKDRSIGFASKVAIKVLNRLKYVPLTYTTGAGFVYSLFASKYHWTMPYSIITSIDLIGFGAVGMAIAIMGMTWAYSGRLISCGWKMMAYGMVLGFFVGPILMIFTSLAFGLRGKDFRFAVLQAVIPQGVVPFVLAQEYNVNPELLCTAVTFQLIVFLPIVIIYFYILGGTG